MTIEFQAIECENADEAIQTTYADPRADRALFLDGRYYALPRTEAQRLEAAGVEFAYLFDHDLPDGRNIIVTVPVND